MKKPKVNSKYADLLKCTYRNNTFESWKDILFVDDATQSIIASNGHRLFAKRTIYPETKVISRLHDSATLIYNKETGLLEKKKYNYPDFDHIIPSQEKLNSKDYRKVIIQIPDWLNAISKKAKEPKISFILNDNPVLALGSGYNNAITLNAHYISMFAGQWIDFYFKGKKDAIVVLPSGQNIDKSQWFYLVMTINNSMENTAPKYVD